MAWWRPQESHGLHLARRNRRIRLREQLLALRLVVKGALVAIRVPVLGAEIVIALALEAQQADLTIAGPAPAGVGLDLFRRFLCAVVFGRAHLSRGYGRRRGRLGGR